MTKHRALHTNASVPRIYLPRYQGGRGLVGIELAYNRTVINVTSKIMQTKDPLLKLVRNHEIANRGAFIYRHAQRAAEALEIQLLVNTPEQDQISTLPPAKRKAILKKSQIEILRREHVGKRIHGIFYKNIDRLQLSPLLTFKFLTAASLKAETEGFITAVQDGVFCTMWYRAEIFHQQVDPTCRACHNSPETTMHLLSACTSYVSTLILKRHNAALRVLYYYLRHKYQIDIHLNIYYIPSEIEAVCSNDRCKIFWNFPFSTLRQIQANKPDLVVQDLEKRIIYIIEFSSPAEHNIDIKEKEKVQKYRDLLISFQQTYLGYKIVFLPLIIGALGGVKGSFMQNLKKIEVIKNNDEKRLTYLMQKEVILGSLRILRAHEASYTTS